MSTRYENGRKMTTKRTFTNGVETVKEYENDVLVSHTVNGAPQAIRGALSASSAAATSSAVASPSSPYHRAGGHHGHRRHHH